MTLLDQLDSHGLYRFSDALIKLAQYNHLDPLQVLGLMNTSTLQDAQASFRNLARKYHPDVNKNPGAEEEFKKINNAFQRINEKPEKYLGKKQPIWDQNVYHFNVEQEPTKPQSRVTKKPDFIPFFRLFNSNRFSS